MFFVFVFVADAVAVVFVPVVFVAVVFVVFGFGSGSANSTAKQRRLFSDMACVFVVAAAGPAMPDVRAEPYNGAVCMWSRVDGVGEDYFLDFK